MVVSHSNMSEQVVVSVYSISGPLVVFVRKCCGPLLQLNMIRGVVELGSGTNGGIEQQCGCSCANVVAHI
jgi:hypothetical protein